MLRTKYLKILEELRIQLNSGDKRFGDKWPFITICPSPFDLAVNRLKENARADKLFDSELVDILLWPHTYQIVKEENAEDREAVKQVPIYEDLPSPDEGRSV